MDHNAEQFAAALWPDRVRAFGRRLQPLCVGHALLLHRLWIDPLNGDFLSQRGDVLLCAYILSLPGHVAADRMGSRGCRWWLAYAAARYRYGWEAEVERLGYALLAGYRAPEFSLRDGATQGRSGMPTDGALLQYLMAGMHWSRSTALDTPRGLAWWFFLGESEREGLIRIEDDQDRRERATLAELRANPDRVKEEMLAMIAEVNETRALAGLTPIKADNFRML